MSNQLLTSTACGLMLALSACGGGGGGSGAPISTPTPPSSFTPPPPPPPPPPPVTTTNFNTTEYQRSNGATSSGAISAWQSGATGSGVKLAIVDSGINPSLPEFVGRIDPASRDVASNRPLGDEDGHGTAVAATAAAARNDSQNVGVAFDATILSFRADSPGTCSGEDGCDFFDNAIAQGVDAARIAGAKVINLSLGGSSPGSILMSAMQRAVSAGIILVISAGNDGNDPLKGKNADPFALIPAQTFPGQVIIAGSVGVADGTGTNLNQLSDFSNQAGQGQNWYLTALGYRVRTIDQTGTGFLYSGTSFSAPIITGAVALMAQAFPNLTARQIVEILFNTADDLGAAGDDAVYGQGRLNIARAFQPVGTTSLAGTAVEVTDESVTGGLPEAAGDSGGQSSFGAVIVDGYDRAFAMNLAKGLRNAGARRPLENSLASHMTGAALQAGQLSVAMSIAQRPGSPGIFDMMSLAIGPEDARRSRLVAGSAVARLDAKTKASFGIGHGSKHLERQLTNAEGGAFLVARDVSGDPGFQARSGTSMAMRRNLGFAGVTIASEQGKVWQDVKLGVDDAPYRYTSVTLDRRFGDNSWGSIGLSRLEEKETLLGGRLGSLYGSVGSSSLFLDAEARQKLGSGWTATIMGRRGWTQFDSGEFTTAAYSFDLAKYGMLRRDDRLGFRIAQPLRVESGGISMLLPTGYDYSSGIATSSTQRLGFAPSGREIDAELSYSTSLGRGWLGANFFARRQPGHVAVADPDLGAAIRYSLGF
ncbi:S8 family serine peptidase [Sphingomonas sp. NSE70-1]|uniref:S8 family serine peptidase n=1 Tax=Sphingomonas caseinilyticus TaxID=2908205 RepID=A0ABT0RVC8_9SPHN|nr:S8 family peptidase [Sphingomonas caseinilyticus]MCL6698947.1 S8 family serine peptidase [Sphingomonas caseinilyticus]